MFRYKEYVYNVYVEKSFSKAADRMHISQPALSATIKKEEEELGAEIFDRSTLPISLTAVGEQYIRAIEQIIEIERDFEKNLKGLELLVSGDLFIGTNHIYATFLFPQILSEYSKKYPNVKIHLKEGTGPQIDSLINSGELDLSIDNVDSEYGSIERIVLSTETILLCATKKVLSEIVPPKNILTYNDICKGLYKKESCPSVNINSFKDCSFILLSKDSNTRSHSDNIFNEAGFQPNKILEVEQLATAYQIVQNSQYVTFASDYIIKHYNSNDELRFCKINSHHARRNIVISKKKTKYTKRSTEEFVRIAKDSDWYD